LTLSVLTLVLPSAILADLNQTATLSTPDQTNLNLETGTVSGSGGDILFTSSGGITPQGVATAVNALPTTLAGFTGVSSLVVQLYPGYSSATIPAATLA
jgi:hypothetical protein